MNSTNENRELLVKDYIMNLSKRYGGMFELTKQLTEPVPEKYSPQLVEDMMRTEYKHHRSSLASALEKKRKFESMTDDERKQMYQDYIDSYKQDDVKADSDNKDNILYYERTIEKLNKWNPDPKYQNIKEQALSDLKSNKDFHTRVQPKYVWNAPSYEEFCASKINYYQSNIEYHQKKLAELDVHKKEYDDYIKGLYDEFDKLGLIDDEYAANVK